MKLPSGCASAAAGRGERGQEREDDEQALHAEYLRAVGLQRSEKCGFVSRARANQRRDSARCPRQRSIIPRWKNMDASRVPSRSDLFDQRERLAAAAVARECPSEHVVAENRGTVGARAPGERERLAEADSVVDAVERGLEVRVDAVGGLDALDHADQVVLRPGFVLPAGGGEKVAELSDEVRERHRLDCASLKLDRPAEPAPRGLDACERVECRHVAGQSGERRLKVARGKRELPEPEMELAELDERPGRRLPDVARGVERKLHRGERLARSAEQLAGVRDPRIAAQAGLQVDLAVERVKRLVVAAELEQGVAEEAVAAGRLRSERHHAACEP